MWKDCSWRQVWASGLWSLIQHSLLSKSKQVSSVWIRHPSLLKRGADAHILQRLSVSGGSRSHTDVAVFTGLMALVAWSILLTSPLNRLIQQYLLRPVLHNSCYLLLFWDSLAACFGPVLLDQSQLATERDTTQFKVSRSHRRPQFCRYRSGNTGGCVVMSAVHQRVLLLRHCLEGGRDCIFRREWAYSPNKQRQTLCLRMLGLLWPGYF